MLSGTIHDKTVPWPSPSACPLIWQGHFFLDSISYSQSIYDICFFFFRYHPPEKMYCLRGLWHENPIRVLSSFIVSGIMYLWNYNILKTLKPGSDITSWNCYTVKGFDTFSHPFMVLVSIYSTAINMLRLAG